MRSRKEITHNLFELRSQLIFIKDMNERIELNEKIEKIRKELIEVSFKEAQDNFRKGRK